MSSKPKPTQNHIYASKEYFEDGTGKIEARGVIRSEASTCSEQCFDNILNRDGLNNDHNVAPQIVGSFLSWFA